jgi:hypothetical protein
LRFHFLPAPLDGAIGHADHESRGFDVAISLFGSNITRPMAMNLCAKGLPSSVPLIA